MSPKYWGPWCLDPTRLVLECYEGRRWVYEVDLEQCTTSAQVLDWIAQVAMKTWATDAVIAGLIRALDAVLDLQSNLCGMGIEHGPVNVAAVVRQ
jgi:hypothetical protein